MSRNRLERLKDGELLSKGKMTTVKHASASAEQLFFASCMFASNHMTTAFVLPLVLLGSASFKYAFLSRCTSGRTFNRTED